MTNETISNEYKVVEIATQSQFLSDFPHHKESVEYDAITTMQWKDEQHAIEKQQWIEKACVAHCNNCYTRYGNCQEESYRMQCQRYVNFKKAMEEL